MPIELQSGGPDPAAFEMAIAEDTAKLFYGIPNSQNPSGITYSEKRRKTCADILAGTRTIFVEDDAYGELRFFGQIVPAL